jgi:mono/diheme cytochrome c family protein
MRSLAVVAILLIAGGGFVYSGFYNVAADEEHWSITADLLGAVRRTSIERHARQVKPPNLDDPQFVRSGAVHYEQMCAMCHLAPGLAETDLRRGLYPKPPDLTEARIDPAAAFWVIKHGVKMSAMPAWGTSHDDETIWSIVAFVQQLPRLTSDDYKAMFAKTSDTSSASVQPAERATAGHSHGSHKHSHEKASAK